MRMGLAVGVVVALVCAAGAARADCNHGKRLFRSTRTPVNYEESRPGSVDLTPVVLDIGAGGAWTRTGERGGDVSGCISRKHLKKLARAVAKAKWKTWLPRMNCRGLASAHYVLQGPKKKQRVERDAPCAGALDTWTSVAETCADALTADAPSEDDIAYSCKPEE
jgi:hypothetical protein